MSKKTPGLSAMIQGYSERRPQCGHESTKVMEWARCECCQAHRDWHARVEEAKADLGAWVTSQQDEVQLNPRGGLGGVFSPLGMKRAGRAIGGADGRLLVTLSEAMGSMWG